MNYSYTKDWWNMVASIIYYKKKILIEIYRQLRMNFSEIKLLSRSKINIRIQYVLMLHKIKLNNGNWINMSILTHKKWLLFREE